MPAPYSVDLRWRIVRACERGTESQRESLNCFKPAEQLLKIYFSFIGARAMGCHVSTPMLVSPYE